MSELEEIEIVGLVSKDEAEQIAGTETSEIVDHFIDWFMETRIGKLLEIDGWDCASGEVEKEDEDGYHILIAFTHEG